MSKEIELKHSFKYHYNNDEVEAKFITIAPFTMKQMHHVAPVKEIVMKALSKLAQSVDTSEVEVKAAQKDAEDIDSSGLIMVIAMNCGEGDLGRLYLYMKKLLTSGVAYIDGSEKLTGTYIDDLNPSDFENICGEYIGNFIT